MSADKVFIIGIAALVLLVLVFTSKMAYEDIWGPGPEWERLPVRLDGVQCYQWSATGDIFCE